MIIKPTDPQITERLSLCSIYFAKTYIKFTKAMCKELGMAEGKRAVISEENGKWFIAITPNDPEGFALRTFDSKAGVLCINSSGLSRMIVKPSKRKLPSSFYISDTGKKLKGYPKYEIMLDKSREELLKQ